MILKRFEANTVGKDYVCGDLHGCYEQFWEALEDIKFNLDTDRMFSVGDLVDRGPESVKCLQLIERPWFHAVRGNHEDMMIGCISGKAYQKVGKRVWYGNGGDWWDEYECSDEVQYYFNFIKKAANLPLIMVVSKPDGSRVNICHAEFPSHCTDQEIDDAENWTHFNLEDLLWKRSRGLLAYQQKVESYSAYNEEDENLSISYMGHTPLPEMTQIGKYNFIDTGLVYRGKLTIVQI